MQRNPSQSRSLDLGPAATEEEGKQGHLGMSAELAAGWGVLGAAGGLGEDPLQGWLGREQQARAVYKRCTITNFARHHLKCAFVQYMLIV